MALSNDEREVSDLEFLQALDPKRRDLAGIRKATEAGDLLTAREALVEHFRTRKRPKWFFDLRDGRRATLTGVWTGPRSSIQASILKPRYSPGPMSTTR